MNPKRVLIRTAIAATALTSSLAAATAQRTFVAVAGVDNASCSLVSPCRSFAAAISATHTGGEIIVLDSAGYGPVTITKAVSIIAPTGIYGGISVSSGNGVTINAPGATVVLRGLSINGQGGLHGVLVQQAGRTRVEHCIVSGMSGNGVYHQAANAETIVADTIARDNADGGFALVASQASMVLDHVRSEHNGTVGFYVAPSASFTTVSVRVRDSVFSHNGSHGLWADTLGSSGTFITIERSLVADSFGDGFLTTAGATSSVSEVLLRDNVFTRNNAGAHVIATFGLAGVRITGNAFELNNSDILVDGGQTVISGNSAEIIQCAHGAVLSTFQDNAIKVMASGCAPTVLPRN